MTDQKKTIEVINRCLYDIKIPEYGKLEIGFQDGRVIEMSVLSKVNKSKLAVNN
jgi:hypothetical protein